VKNSPKMWPNPFLVKMNAYIHNFYRGKSCPKACDISVIYKKLPKLNNRPIGKNSSNLATLITIAHEEQISATGFSRLPKP
jgi:hypothetical protein